MRIAIRGTFGWMAFQDNIREAELWREHGEPMLLERSACWCRGESTRLKNMSTVGRGVPGQ